MANASRSFITARATLVAAASLVLLGTLASQPIAASAGGKRAILVSAKYNDGFQHFGYDSLDDNVRKVGQTFVAPSSGVKLSSVSLMLAGKGTAVVKVYETGKRAPLGKLLGTVRTRVKRSKWYFLQVRPLIPMDTDRRYSFVLSVKGGKTILGTGLGTEYPGGQRHCLCPTRIRGEKFDDDHYSWQSSRRLGNISSDVMFRMRFRRSRSSL